ncbi:MAG: XdhC family protein, partial [Acidobacteria bacterium]|nr:XdhC family protein [Acidobacteriota bacterium]
CRSPKRNGTSATDSSCERTRISRRILNPSGRSASRGMAVLSTRKNPLRGSVTSPSFCGKRVLARAVAPLEPSRLIVLRPVSAPSGKRRLAMTRSQFCFVATATISGTRSGGCCRSASMTTKMSFSAARNPAKTALESPCRYIGALGSRKTHARRVASLKEMGITDEQLSRIHAPIGLNLGGRRPAEIAVAILGQIIAIRNGVGE